MRRLFCVILFSKCFHAQLLLKASELRRECGTLAHCAGAETLCVKIKDLENATVGRHVALDKCQLQLLRCQPGGAEVAPVPMKYCRDDQLLKDAAVPKKRVRRHLEKDITGAIKLNTRRRRRNPIKQHSRLIEDTTEAIKPNTRRRRKNSIKQNSRLIEDTTGAIKLNTRRRRRNSIKQHSRLIGSRVIGQPKRKIRRQSNINTGIQARRQGPKKPQIASPRAFRQVTDMIQKLANKGINLVKKVPRAIRKKIVKEAKQWARDELEDRFNITIPDFKGKNWKERLRNLALGYVKNLVTGFVFDELNRIVRDNKVFPNDEDQSTLDRIEEWNNEMELQEYGPMIDESDFGTDGNEMDSSKPTLGFTNYSALDAGYNGKKKKKKKKKKKSSVTPAGFNHGYEDGYNGQKRSVTPGLNHGYVGGYNGEDEDLDCLAYGDVGKNQACYSERPSKGWPTTEGTVSARK